MFNGSLPAPVRAAEKLSDVVLSLRLVLQLEQVWGPPQ